MPAQKRDDWSLLVNAPVEIRQDGEVLRTGIIDDAMPDSSVLWIAADGNQPREMFEASLGHEAWITPQELSGRTRYQLTATRPSEQEQPRT